MSAVIEKRKHAMASEVYVGITRTLFNFMFHTFKNKYTRIKYAVVTFTKNLSSGMIIYAAYLPSTNRTNPRGFLARMDSATRVISANEGSPLGLVSRSASKSR